MKISAFFGLAAATIIVNLLIWAIAIGGGIWLVVSVLRWMGVQI